MPYSLLNTVQPDPSPAQTTSIILQDTNDILNDLRQSQSTDFQTEILAINNHVKANIEDRKFNMAAKTLNQVNIFLKQNPSIQDKLAENLKNALLHNNVICLLQQRNYDNCGKLLQTLILTKTSFLEAEKINLSLTQKASPNFSFSILSQRKLLARYLLLQSQVHNYNQNFVQALTAAQKANQLLKSIFLDIYHGYPHRALNPPIEQIIKQMACLKEPDPNDIQQLRAATKQQILAWEKRLMKNEASKPSIRQCQLRPAYNLDAIAFVGDNSPDNSCIQQMQSEDIYGYLYFLADSFMLVAKNQIILVRKKMSEGLNAAEINYSVAVLLACAYFPCEFRLTKYIVTMYEQEIAKNIKKMEQHTRTNWKHLLLCTNGASRNQASSSEKKNVRSEPFCFKYKTEMEVQKKITREKSQRIKSIIVAKVQRQGMLGERKNKMEKSKHAKTSKIIPQLSYISPRPHHLNAIPQTSPKHKKNQGATTKKKSIFTDKQKVGRDKVGNVKVLQKRGKSKVGSSASTSGQERFKKKSQSKNSIKRKCLRSFRSKNKESPTKAHYLTARQEYGYT